MIVDIEDDIMDPVMQCTTLPSHSGFSQKKLVSFVTEIHTLSIDISLRDCLEFARNNGSNTVHLSSNIVRMNSNNATRSALKSPLKRNHGKWKISFYKGTEVTRIDQIDDNLIGFVNEPFSRILGTNNEYHDHDCVDVIGSVVSVGDIVPVNGYGYSKVRRTVVIEDTHYEANTGYNASEFKIEIHNPDSHVVTPAEFMQGCLRKMVGMIHDIEPETYCVVYATIHSIQYENGWAYTACKACNTKVTPIQTKVGSSSRNKKQLWHFKNHGETYAVVSRFKIIVRIFDESGSAQIIGKQYLFKIKYSQFNHNNNSHVYRAEKVIEDVETINYFKNGFVKYEDEDEDYDCESNEINENERDDYTLQNEKDDHTSPSVEINENVQDDFENNEITTTNEQASEPKKTTLFTLIYQTMKQKTKSRI
ncbi:replication protein A 70 kDa DNA-binding subunit B [Tanacetum coccineum]